MFPLTFRAKKWYLILKTPHGYRQGFAVCGQQILRIFLYAFCILFRRLLFIRGEAKALQCQIVTLEGVAALERMYIRREVNEQ